MTVPPISVLMPARNAQEYVGRAVASTLRSMCHDSELIVFDDSSEDATPKILDRMQDRRLRLLHGRSGPVGVPAALNLLIRESKHAIIARMDADDICLPWRFRYQLQKLSDLRSDFLFSTGIYINERGKPLRPSNLRKIPCADISERLLWGNPLIHPTMVAKRQAILDLGGYKTSAAEDYELWMRAAAAGYSLSRSRLPVLLYRQHGLQETGSGVKREETRRAWFGDRALVDSWCALRSRVDGVPLISAAAGETLDTLIANRQSSRTQGGGFAT